MNWIILFTVGTVVTIISFAIFLDDRWRFSDFAGVVGIITLAVVIITFTCFVVGLLSTPKEINNFVQQKAYIESHKAESEIEDAALTAKKIELNGWLYDAQNSKSRFGGWSLYPDSIFDLEPIQ